MKHRMIKKIKIEDIKAGMYLVEITEHWRKRLSLNKNMYVEDESLIETLRKEGIKEILIDPTKSIDLSKKTVKDSFEKANDVRERVGEVVNEVFEDFKNGKPVSIEKSSEVMESVVDLATENKFALAGLIAMQKKGQYFLDHAISSSVLMVACCDTLGYDSKKQQEMGLGAMLHDIGMVKVPTHIINKPGKLTPDEQRILREHVVHGYNMLKDVPNIPESTLLMAYQHHERIDGSGYPRGLKGTQVAEHIQLLGIIDTYDAATSFKGYKNKISHKQALSEIMVKYKNQFSTDLVNTFVQSVGIFPLGSIVELANGVMGIITEIEMGNLVHPKLRIIYDPKQGGLIKPYDMDLQERKADPFYKITSIETKEKLFLAEKDINWILNMDTSGNQSSSGVSQ